MPSMSSNRTQTELYVKELPTSTPGREGMCDRSISRRIRSRSLRNKLRPLRTTAAIVCVLRMSSSGFASSRTRSAIFPFQPYQGRRPYPGICRINRSGLQSLERCEPGGNETFKFAMQAGTRRYVHAGWAVRSREEGNTGGVEFSYDVDLMRNELFANRKRIGVETLQDARRKLRPALFAPVKRSVLASGSCATSLFSSGASISHWPRSQKRVGHCHV